MKKKSLISLITVFILSAAVMFSACADEFSGGKRIVLAWDFGINMPVWQRIAEEYTALNEDVTIVLDQKDGQSYSSWLSGQLGKANKDADIVVNNTVQQYFSPQYFVDFSEYIFRPNKYADNEIWKDVLENGAYAETRGTKKGQIFSLNNLQVITAWFYNKDIFDELNIVEKVGKEPMDWNFDDLIDACALIKAGGYIPLSLSGVYQSFWAKGFGWLFRTYTDQYFRDLETMALAQPGDYLYDEELQSLFILDLNDPYNDEDEGFIVNDIRLAKMLSDWELGPSHERFQDMIRNFSRLVPEYVPQGFTSLDLSESGRMFIKGEAAIFFDLLDFYAGIERTFADVGAIPFEVGLFKYPPMTGELVSVDYTRDMGGPAGNYGIIYKNKQQADLCADFLQFFLSPRGQSIFFEEMEKENIAPSGVSLVKDVEMPERWQGKYDVVFNGSADRNPLVNWARGFFDEQESVRGFVELSQSYFREGSTISIETYSRNLHQNAINAIPYWLRSMDYRQNALDNPSLNPAR